MLVKLRDTFSLKLKYLIVVLLLTLLQFIICITTKSVKIDIHRNIFADSLKKFKFN